jgi:hypothetical protein
LSSKPQRFLLIAPFTVRWQVARDGTSAMYNTTDHCTSRLALRSCRLLTAYTLLATEPLWWKVLHQDQALSHMHISGLEPTT